MNSKTGLYPLYVAYSIYVEKCKKYPDNALTIDKKNAIWRDTLANNIFVICKTPMAKEITRRTLAGYKNYKVNAHYFEDLVNMLEHKQRQFIDKITRPNYWERKDSKKMEFDAIVGNPPYQETNDKNSRDMSIYYLFMNTAFNISKRVSFITPARFLFNAGSTPKEWNKKVLNDEHFKVVLYKEDSTEIFPSVDIKGGVAITLRDTEQNFGKIGNFTPIKEVKNILEKVLNNGIEPLSKYVYTKSSYSLTELLYKEHAELKGRLTKGNTNIVDANIFKKMPEIFLENKPKDEKDYIMVYGREANNRVYKWIDKRYITEHENLYKYKVFVTGANGKGALGEVLSSPVIANPGVAHTQTFISIGAFDTEFEAKACLKYIKTKFARFLLSTLKVTQNNPKDTWANIPKLDFTTNSDVNWEDNLKEIDKQLYTKYNLTEEEIMFIEKNVKEM